MNKNKRVAATLAEKRFLVRGVLKIWCEMSMIHSEQTTQYQTSSQIRD